MTSFEYIGVLISVLLGLAITHLMVGIISTVQNRNSTRVYWVHLLWVANTLIFITQFWWYINMWRGLESWSLEIFYLIFGYALLLSAIAGLLFPIHGMVRDFRNYYYDHFRWFFGLWVLILSVDMLEVWTKASLGLRSIPPDYFAFTVPMLWLFLIAIFVKNEKYHASLAIIMFLWQTLWVITNPISVMSV